MIFSINPKAQFIQTTTDEMRQVYNDFMSQPLARMAAVHTLAHLVAIGASKEQLEGAKAFADTFLNLGVPNESAPTFPSKDLKQQ